MISGPKHCFEHSAWVCVSRLSGWVQFRREDPSLRLRRNKGERQHAIGRSRCGRTTKIRALTDRTCYPVAFIVIGGNIADYTPPLRCWSKPQTPE